MKVQVFHADRPTFRATEPCPFPEGYTLVASFELATPHGNAADQCATARDVAFQRTNHVAAPWHEAPGIDVHMPSPRSTSVGDVVVVDGIATLCAPTGWIHLLPKETD